MRKILFLLPFIFLCCKRNAVAEKTWTKNDSIQRAYQIGTVNKKTGRILGKTYHAFLTDTDYAACITDERNDTVFKSKITGAVPEFTDFNRDGITDILFHANVKEEGDLILFDTVVNKFKKVKDFEMFPAAVKIDGGKYYYSYHASGCADESWDSELFFIENFTAKSAARLSVTCTIEEIFLIKSDDTLRRFPMKTLDKFATKWDFIDHYWKAEYRRL